jgi:hypothetical protein
MSMQLLPFAAVNYQILKSWEIAVVSLKNPILSKNEFAQFT